MNDAVAASELKKRTVGKIFLRLIPMIFILYIIAYLDRVNISFAALTMNKALGLSAAAFGFGAGIFGIGYFLMEIPGNLIMTRVGAHTWFMRILVSWGIIAAAMALVKNPTEYYICRFLLGLAEASFAPAILYYFGLWFRARDFSKAFAYMAISIPVAAILGAPFSTWLLGKAWFGVAGWQWVFIIEGAPAVILGIVAYFYFADYPQQAKWLKDDEKEWIIQAIAAEKQEKEKRRKMTLAEAFGNANVIYLTLTYLTFTAGTYGFNLFMPTLIKAMHSGMSNQTVGWLVMIPNIVALIAMVLVSWHSDKTGQRLWYAAGGLFVTAVTLVLSLLFIKTSVGLSVACFSLCMAGFYSALAPIWALPNSFLAGVNAAAAFALINSVGGLGAFVGPWVMGLVTTATHSSSLGIIIMAGLVFIAALIIVFSQQNVQKQITSDYRAGRQVQG